MKGVMAKFGSNLVWIIQVLINSIFPLEYVGLQLKAEKIVRIKRGSI